MSGHEPEDWELVGVGGGGTELVEEYDLAGEVLERVDAFGKTASLGFERLMNVTRGVFNADLLEGRFGSLMGASSGEREAVAGSVGGVVAMREMVATRMHGIIEMLSAENFLDGLRGYYKSGVMKLGVAIGEVWGDLLRGAEDLYTGLNVTGQMDDGGTGLIELGRSKAAGTGRFHVARGGVKSDGVMSMAGSGEQDTGEVQPVAPSGALAVDADTGPTTVPDDEPTVVPEDETVEMGDGEGGEEGGEEGEADVQRLAFGVELKRGRKRRAGSPESRDGLRAMKESMERLRESLAKEKLRQLSLERSQGLDLSQIRSLATQIVANIDQQDGNIAQTLFSQLGGQVVKLLRSPWFQHLYHEALATPESGNSPVVLNIVRAFGDHIFAHCKSDQLKDVRSDIPEVFTDIIFASGVASPVAASSLDQAENWDDVNSDISLLPTSDDGSGVSVVSDESTGQGEPVKQAEGSQSAALSATRAPKRQRPSWTKWTGRVAAAAVALTAGLTSGHFLDQGYKQIFATRSGGDEAGISKPAADTAVKLNTGTGEVSAKATTPTERPLIYANVAGVSAGTAKRAESVDARLLVYPEGSSPGSVWEMASGGIEGACNVNDADGTDAAENVILTANLTDQLLEQPEILEALKARADQSNAEAAVANALRDLEHYGWHFDESAAEVLASLGNPSEVHRQVAAYFMTSEDLEKLSTTYKLGVICPA